MDFAEDFKLCVAHLTTLYDLVERNRSRGPSPHATEWVSRSCKTHRNLDIRESTLASPHLPCKGIAATSNEEQQIVSSSGRLHAEVKQLCSSAFARFFACYIQPSTANSFPRAYERSMSVTKEGQIERRGQYCEPWKQWKPEFFDRPHPFSQILASCPSRLHHQTPLSWHSSSSSFLDTNHPSGEKPKTAQKASQTPWFRVSTVSPF